MAQRKATKGTSVEWQGPAPQGGNEVGLPRNPSDEIFQGRTLPIVPAQAQTERRGFSVPIKPTLHYRDGLDGAAETVTVRERRFSDDQTGAELDNPPYPGTQLADTDDFGEFGAQPGTDANKYSENPNEAYTSNGQWIRGT